MIKELAKSIREYKRASILAPVYVIGEVVMEAVIPFIIAKMVNQIKAGATVAVIWEYGGVLLALAMVSLLFGYLAGNEAATASAGFGMKVVGCDPFISVESAWALSSSVRRAATNEDVFAQADYITFHVPLNDKTRGSINAATIAKMKKGAILLNFSRGELANTADVKAALASGQLGGYVTDFPCEELLGVEKVTCIPHLGASTPESEDNCARMAAAELRDYLEVGSIRNSVNLPDVPLGAPEGVRVLVIHENIPNMVATITTCVSAEQINIDNLVNKSRKDVAVTVMELSDRPSKMALNVISSIAGVIRVRVFG